ncbi:hypothetical protein LTR17_017251 [Elasticomyces elasticus]|nr:hypothetical protein LTR17_017251 [Elasticomyces elasticus]
MVHSLCVQSRSNHGGIVVIFLNLLNNDDLEDLSQISIRAALTQDLRGACFSISGTIPRNTYLPKRGHWLKTDMVLWRGLYAAFVNSLQGYAFRIAGSSRHPLIDVHGWNLEMPLVSISKTLQALDLTKLSIPAPPLCGIMGREEKRTERMEARRRQIQQYDYHAALDDYNKQWEAVLPHQTTTTPLPSIGLNLAGLQSNAACDADGVDPSAATWQVEMLLKANVFRWCCKAFGLAMEVVQTGGKVKLKLRADASEAAEVSLLLRQLLNKEQHRFSPESMKWRTGQMGTYNDAISEGTIAKAIRAAIRELIVECTGDGDEEEMSEDDDAMDTGL